MNKSILYLVTIFIINYSYAQEKIEKHYNYAKGNLKESGQINKGGLPKGEWKYYLENGTLDYIINWTTNCLKDFYTTGELKETHTFNPDTGARIGECITYYKNGKIKTKEIYDENGQLKNIEIFKEGLKQN